MIGSLRHLRILLAVDETRSVTKAAERCHVSQPAVTLALGKMERVVGVPLFDRTPQGLFATREGKVLCQRIARAFSVLDPALVELAPRLKVTVTAAQLQSLIAVAEAESFSEAARRLGLAQPTVHRAVSQVEREVGQPLFERTAYGIIASRATRMLAIAARLAFAELEQARVDLADLAGEEVGCIVVGAMPLSRAFLLGPAIARFRKRHPKLLIRVIEGPYEDMALGLRRGEIDFLIGALRPKEAAADFDQEELFQDEMVIVARPGHPLTREEQPAIDRLAAMPWVVSGKDTPARRFFDSMFDSQGTGAPQSIVETGSIVLMRELLRHSDHLGFISARQVAADVMSGSVVLLSRPFTETSRPIGLSTRKDWMPTNAQADFIEEIRWASRLNPGN